MIIKNKTNGKEILLTKKQYDSLSVIAKMNFTIINQDDEVKSSDQVVANKIVAEKKQAPDNGEKK